MKTPEERVIQDHGGYLIPLAGPEELAGPEDLLDTSPEGVETNNWQTCLMSPVSVPASLADSSSVCLSPPFVPPPSSAHPAPLPAPLVPGLPPSPNLGPILQIASGYDDLAGIDDSVLAGMSGQSEPTSQAVLRRLVGSYLSGLDSCGLDITASLSSASLLVSSNTRPSVSESSPSVPGQQYVGDSSPHEPVLPPPAVDISPNFVVANDDKEINFPGHERSEVADLPGVPGDADTLPEESQGGGEDELSLDEVARRRVSFKKDLERVFSASLSKSQVNIAIFPLFLFIHVYQDNNYI